MSAPEDRFRDLAANYDAWIGWNARLAKELPFLLASLPPERAETPAALGSGGILDVGCGTGAHALALAAAGLVVTGVDRSEAMITEARAAEERARQEGRLPQDARIQWVVGDILDVNALEGRWYRAVLALGNALLSFGEEAEVRAGLEAMVRLTAPGGTLLLQYLNGGKIRSSGRLSVKGSPSGEGEEIWLRHHFSAGKELRFHSYRLLRRDGVWQVEFEHHPMVDLAVERVQQYLRRQFERVEVFEGLSGTAFRAEESDAVGVRASGRR